MKSLQITYLSLFVAIAISAPAQDKKLIAKSLELDLKPHEYSLRHTPNYSGNLYLNVGTNEFICKQGHSGIFPNKIDVEGIKIVEIDFTSETEVLTRKILSEPGKPLVTKNETATTFYWRFKLKHKFLGKGEIRLTSASGELPIDLQKIKSALGYVLAGGDLPLQNLFCGNLSSMKLHFIGSGHTPALTNSIDFSSEQAGLSAGYTKCSLCFRESTLLSFLGLEQALGKETEAHLRSYYGVSDDAENLQRIKQVARRVLTNWPAPLKGYNYRFCLLDEDSYNASACPAGYIFIHSGLLRILESQDELEAVLAHEIAHVEQRHGLKEYLKAQRDAKSAAIAGVIVSGAATVAVASSRNPNTQATAIGLADVGFALIQFARQTATFGYSREHEKEADLLAAAYLLSQQKSTKPLIAVLKKIRSHQDLVSRDQTEQTFTTTHPTIKDRLFVAENVLQTYFDEPIIFDGYAKDGTLVFTIRILSQCSYDERTGTERFRLLTDLTTTSALETSEKITGLALNTPLKAAEFKTDDKLEVFPLDTTGLAFVGNSQIDFENPKLTVALRGISVGQNSAPPHKFQEVTVVFAYSSRCQQMKVAPWDHGGRGRYYSLVEKLC